jgi:hypothetical protein
MYRVYVIKQRKGGSEVLADTRTQTASFAAASAAFWDLYSRPLSSDHLLLMSKDKRQTNAYRYGSQPGDRDYIPEGAALRES